MSQKRNDENAAPVAAECVPNTEPTRNGAAENVPISTPEDDAWVNQSWNTLRERMDDDEE
jgi:hypothetical protein